MREGGTIIKREMHWDILYKGKNENKWDEIKTSHVAEIWSHCSANLPRDENLQLIETCKRGNLDRGCSIEGKGLDPASPHTEALMQIREMEAF